jgi:hypothetical protein
MFDRIVIVDWSAANHRKKGRDSIWICQHGSEPLNLGTRAEAKENLGELLADAIEKGERTLVGFDFPFGYPAGLAARLGLDGAEPWRSVWNEIARLVKDGNDNRNNRFCVGAELNRQISKGGVFPFWGCPASKEGPYLRQKKYHKGHDTDVLAERRLIDEPRYMQRAQPCWKLFYNGSVGGQALTGIPIVRALRDDPRWSDVARVWPFETGLCAPQDARIVFAEVYPSLWKWDFSQEQPRDKVQVRSVAQCFADLDSVGGLAPLFAGDPNLTEEQRHRVIVEEAWTLGVIGPGRGSELCGCRA